MDVILECNFLEVIQKMWRRDVRPEMLEENDSLLSHLDASFLVIHDAHVRLKYEYCCIPGSVASSFEKRTIQFELKSSIICMEYHYMRTWYAKAIELCL